jgi:gamma-glutamyltranspeptidase/glutathione hydrolase
LLLITPIDVKKYIQFNLIFSGRCAANLSIDKLEKDFGISVKDHAYLPVDSIHTITVPGAAAGWADTIEGSSRISGY